MDAARLAGAVTRPRLRPERRNAPVGFLEEDRSVHRTADFAHDERAVVDELAEHSLAELLVLVGVEDVGVPRRVYGFHHREGLVGVQKMQAHELAVLRNQGVCLLNRVAVPHEQGGQPGEVPAEQLGQTRLCGGDARRCVRKRRFQREHWVCPFKERVHLSLSKERPSSL